MGLKLVGDYAARKDNQPLGENVGGFLHKTMRIAGSGIYRYHRSEASLFGLDPSALPGDQAFFNIYRPPEVLKKHKDMFARIPLITGRHVQVNLENAKDLAVGWVGDTIDVETDPKDGEVYLYTTGTIISGDGVQAYEESGQLSVGYVPTARWEKGTHRGEKYDAVLVSFRDVNHLLLCKEARGGPQIMVMDSLDSLSPLEKFIESRGGTKVGVFEKIFGSRKSAAVVGDARIPVLLQSIAVGADPKTQVDAIKALVGDAKTDVQKEFHSFLDELSSCKDESLDTKVKAVDIVSSFYLEKVAGDSSGAPDKDKGEKVDDKQTADSTGKKQEAGEAGDSEEEAKKKAEEEAKKRAEESAGDSSAIFKAIESLTKEITELKKAAVTMPTEVKSNEQAIGAMRLLVGGDSAAQGKTSTDDFVKSLL